jgi:hypothetical protein
VRETKVLGGMKSVGVNATNLSTVVGLVNPRDVSAYEPWVRDAERLLSHPYSRALFRV